MNKKEESYSRHCENDERQYGVNGQRTRDINAWIDQKSVGAWRHRRMLSAVDPLIEAYPKARWLTVGDSMFGSDAHYLLEHGVDVTASNISDAGFEEAAKRGHIKKWSVQNAEALTYPDGEYDFVLCKEAYHHFPRPPVAMYEMLRVARIGVVLIEPNDRYILDTPFQAILNNRIFYWLLANLLGLKEKRFDFEPTGNYVFSISKREIEKIALGLHCRLVAFRGVNDYATSRDHYEPALSGNAVYRRAGMLVGMHNVAAWLRLIKYRNLCAIVLKSTASTGVAGTLRLSGFDVMELPAFASGNPVP